MVRQRSEAGAVIMLDTFIRMNALIQYTVMATFREPFERYMGTIRYLSAVIGAHEIYINFVSLPEEAKRTMREKSKPWLIIIVLAIVIGVAM